MLSNTSGWPCRRLHSRLRRLHCLFELHHKPHTLSLSPITPTVALRVGTAVSRPRQDLRQSALRASRRPQWLQFHLQHALSAAVLTLITARPVEWHTCFVKSSSSRCLSVGSTPSTRTPATSDVRQQQGPCAALPVCCLRLGYVRLLQGSSCIAAPRRDAYD